MLIASRATCTLLLGLMLAIGLSLGRSGGSTPTWNVMPSAACGGAVLNVGSADSMDALFHRLFEARRPDKPVSSAASPSGLLAAGRAELLVAEGAGPAWTAQGTSAPIRRIFEPHQPRAPPGTVTHR